MALNSSIVADAKIKESSKKGESTKKLVWWMLVFSFGAGAVTAVLIYHLRMPSNGEWLFDVAVGLPCVLYARFYALRLLGRN